MTTGVRVPAPAMVRKAVALFVAAASVGLALVAAPPAEGTFTREFRVRAKAFPIEPDPGQNQQAFSVRPVSTEAAVASAPMGANGRAAVLDLGFIENQFPPPEESFARCDTVSPNVPDAETRTAGPMRFTATCGAGPDATVTADGISPASFFPPEVLEPLGVSGGVLAARSVTRASADALSAEAVSAVTDLTVGPLEIEELRFRAEARTTGAPGGATATWSLDVLAASVNGVPVVIGTGGVQVDDQQVPAPFLTEATRAVQEGFARSGGRVDVRILAPAVQRADDGSSASVRGGGLHVFLTSSDNPAERYFAGLTLLGADVSVAAGAPRTEALRLEPFTAGSPRTGVPLEARPASPAVRGGSVAAPAPAPMAAAPAAEAPRVNLATATARRPLAEPAPAWLVPLVVGAAALALGVASRQGPLLAVRRRVLAGWELTAERFLRG